MKGWEAIKSKTSGRIAPLLVIGIAIILAFSLVLILAMKAMGWEIIREDKVEVAPPPPPEIVSTNWSVSPASNTLKKVLANPPKGWEVQGNLLQTPQPPYPFSCETEGITPALSYAQNFKANGKKIQVYTSAYTAGLAEAGLTDEINRAKSCGGGTYGLYKISSLTDGFQVNVNMSTQKTKTIIFRAGDVLVFVIGDSGNGNLLSASKAFDESLRKALSGGICKSLEYSGQETSRSPYSNDDYKGFYTTNKVVIPKVELPKIEDEAKFKQVAIGSKLTSLKEVNIPSKPVSYPVWPELPEEVDKPVEPKTPAKKADTEKKYKQLTEDKVGPGCGWDFTGSIAPVFSKANADKENEETRTRTEEELVEASKEWQASVLTYWEEFDKYEKQAPKWNKYVDEVAEVSEAWDEIKREWNTYYANYDIWLKQVEARDSFLNRQEQAKKSYENAIQECKVWEAEQKQKEADRKKEEEERKKNDESNPDTDSTESPTPTEEPEDENAPQCPAVKPAIIDQAPPSVGAEPTKPADPRPESERD